jgi:nucleoside-diphosphate-sugar epimerase
MSTIAITGAASGIGAATTARLRNEGHTVIGVDLRDTAVIADLATAEGRQSAVAEVLDACDGVLDGLVTCAGLSGYPGRPGSLLASLNYFGTIEVMEGLRPALARSRLGVAKNYLNS